MDIVQPELVLKNDNIHKSGKGGTAEQADVSDRLIILDAVRAFAILLVIGHHAAYRFRPMHGDIVGNFLRSVGWIGVDVFFALSGFLIVKMLIRDTERRDLKGFFVRRFFRIVPIFAIAVLLYAVLSLVIGYEIERINHIWMTALFLNGWVMPFYGLEAIPFTITWSLSVEEFAYIVLGSAAAVSIKALRYMVVVFLITALMVRLAVLWTGWFEPASLYVFVPARLDAIAFGGLGAMGAYKSLSSRFWPTIAGVSVLALMIAFQWTPVSGYFLPSIGYSFFALVCGIWVTKLVSLPPRAPGFIVRMVAPFGKLSYFIYLFHVFVLEGLRLAQVKIPGLHISFWSAVMISSILVFFAAKISWRYIEEPLIRRGHRSAAQARISA